MQLQEDQNTLDIKELEELIDVKEIEEVLKSKEAETKKKKRRRLLFAAFPVILLFVLILLFGRQADSNTIFDGEEYQYKLVYSLQREGWEDASIIKLYEKMEQICGVEPEVLVDSETPEGGKEILIGPTNRDASRLPELGEKDCYWSVEINHNQIVINGSNENMLNTAVDYLISHWDEAESEGKLTVSPDWTKEVTMKEFYRDGWLLTEVPAYQGENELATQLYNTGTYITEYGKTEASVNQMMGIWSTNEKELEAYTEVLALNGYAEESHSSMENNQFYRFVKENQRVYVNYYGNEKRVTVELDKSGRPSLAEVSYTYEPKAGEEAEFYMFGLKMDPYGYSKKQEKNTSGYIDNGACMVVKCADNSIIMIDGGGSEQMMYDDQERLWKFLHEITGKPMNEKIDIAAWFITHFDSDHTCGFSTVLETTPERYNVQRVICNLPDLELTSKSDPTAIIKPSNALSGKYPNIQDIKLRTGDVIQIADVTISTVFTHTDFADNAGRFNTTNFNTTSSVVMMETSAGMKMQVTGDIMAKGETILVKNFSKETLKADIFQQPHHNRTDISTMYECADAQVMFFTQAVGTLTENETDLARSTLAKSWCSEWYCGGTETVGFKWAGDRAQLIYQKEDIYQ